MNQLFSLVSIFFLSINILVAQSDLAIGQWKSHLPYDVGWYVTQSDTKIYYSTALSLLILDKEDESIERLTKVEGLSNVGISLIKYNRGAQTLMVIYDGGVMDLISEDEIFTVFDIANSNLIVGKKEVYDVFMLNDSIAYLAANFGVTKFNLKTGRSPVTTKFPIPVKSVLVKDNIIFAGTEDGIFTADLTTNVNVDDFNNWEELGPEKGFPEIYHSEAMAVFNDKIYLEINDSLYRYDGQSAEFVFYENFDDLSPWISYITAEGTKLMVGFRALEDDKKSGRLLVFDENLQATQVPSSCVSRPNYGIEDEKGQLWLAEGKDNQRDFRKIDVNGDCCSTCKIKVNSPYTSDIRDIIVQDGEVWVASGGIDAAASPNSNIDGTFSYIDGTWDFYNKFSLPKEDNKYNIDDHFVVRKNPENGKVYMGTYHKGLIEYDGENFELYNEDNSNLEPGNLTPDVRIGGLAFDSENNLWISNNIAATPLHVLQNDGTWLSFNPSCASENDFLDITIDAFGYKWIILANDNNRGIYVFDEGDIKVAGDDQCHIISSSNSQLPSNRVNAVTVDLDGSVWVGTETGAIVFECDVINSDCPGSLRIGELDEFGAHLFEDQNIQTIAVDGANRKWFGTLSGIFVLSPSGEEQVASYTVDNSPLFDNHIIDIAFDHTTGEAYIGTAKGLQTLRTEATIGGPINSRDVLVFPNPVRPDYTGLIAIKGLAQDADVKITDISGQLVYETTALGGQAIWDGRDYNGRKANSGVYLVFSTNDSNTEPEAIVAKILFMN